MLKFIVETFLSRHDQNKNHPPSPPPTKTNSDEPATQAEMETEFLEIQRLGLEDEKLKSPSIILLSFLAGLKPTQ